MGKSQDQAFTTFLAECLRFGTLKGFKFIQPYVLSREELLVSITPPLGSDGPQALSFMPADQGNFYPPPASPCEAYVEGGTTARRSQHFFPADEDQFREDLRKSASKASVVQNPSSVGSDHTASFEGSLSGTYRRRKSFTTPMKKKKLGSTGKGTEEVILLLGTYIRYGAPFVWLRSHPEFAAASTIGSNDPEAIPGPVDLSSLSNWENQPTPFWFVMEQLVMAVRGDRENECPFAVNMEYVRSLPPREASLVSAGLLFFLTQVSMNSRPYDDLLFEDIAALSQLHFATAPWVVPNMLSPTDKGDLPATRTRALSHSHGTPITSPKTASSPVRRPNSSTPVNSSSGPAASQGYPSYRGNATGAPGPSKLSQGSQNKVASALFQQNPQMAHSGSNQPSAYTQKKSGIAPIIVPKGQPSFVTFTAER